MTMILHPQREELSVEFDPEVAELLLVGMVVTGTYNLLSDGTWCFTQVCTARPSALKFSTACCPSASMRSNS